MGEIIVSDPQTNKDFMRDHTAEDRWLREMILRDFMVAKITPERFPMVCDLCAGNGAISRLLTWLEWKPQQITSVDIYKPDHPFVEGLGWKYWDLMQLGKALKYNSLLPHDIARYKERFDVVTMITGIDEYNSHILRFLLKPGGIACPHPGEDELLYDTKRWEKIPDTRTLIRRIS